MLLGQPEVGEFKELGKGFVKRVVIGALNVLVLHRLLVQIPAIRCSAFCLTEVFSQLSIERLIVVILVPYQPCKKVKRSATCATADTSKHAFLEVYVKMVAFIAAKRALKVSAISALSLTRLLTQPRFFDQRPHGT